MKRFTEWMTCEHAVAYIVYDPKTNLYWSRHPEGWVSKRHEASWSDLHDANQDAKLHGGMVVSIDSSDPAFTGSRNTGYFAR
jgi:hypothetical protein